MKKIQINKGYVGEKNGVRCVLTNSPEVQLELKKRADIKKGILYGILAALIVTFVINILILPATGNYDRVGEFNKTSDNPYVVNFYTEKDVRPMVSAHRAGALENPEETWMAFQKCVDSGFVNILELDLHLSKDNKLILLHDHELDRTSNSAEKFGKGKKVKDLTLEQLKTLNMGYSFTPIGSDEMIYRNLPEEEIDARGLRIQELDETMDQLKAYMGEEKFMDMRFIIEIKDGGERGKTAMDLLYESMVKHDIVDNVVVGTFQQSITDHIDKKTKAKEYVGVHRSAGILDALNFYYSFLYGTEPNHDFDVMQIPTGGNGFFDMSTKAFMDYAHSHGIALQYWTINDPEEVEKLLLNGADAIITDNTEMTYNKITEVAKRFN